MVSREELEEHKKPNKKLIVIEEDCDAKKIW